MRRVLLPALIVSAIGLSGAAFAASAATGAIKSIDAKAMSITLDNGTVYMLPQGFKIDSVKVGEKVSLMWTEKAGKYEASEVKAAS